MARPTEGQRCASLNSPPQRALLVAIGDLATMTDRFGDHGYRLVLLRAGAVLQRCWIAAARLGMAGCLCEAPYLWSDRRSLYPLDAGDVQLLAFALGSAGGEANGEVP